jgi:hypothetical protein
MNLVKTGAAILNAASRRLPKIRRRERFAAAVIVRSSLKRLQRAFCNEMSGEGKTKRFYIEGN